ncbi:MAG: ribonuclease P protein component [Salinibacterium sp.]|nr:MAG: ribonuclease P protein component [Salinibacterium sp.]
MLARANRVTRSADFRATLRRGRRVPTNNTVIHIAKRENLEPTRFGFIVAKTVGGAVTRNLVRRRLRASCFDVLDIAGTGMDVVIRALPASASASWATLHSEIAEAITMGMASA